MAKCIDCKQEMTRATTCTVPTIKIMGKEYQRNTEYHGVGARCHDCGILNRKGNIHHFGCDLERCPRCGGQLFSCNCKSKDVREVFPFVPVNRKTGKVGKRPTSPANIRYHTTCAARVK